MDSPDRNQLPPVTVKFPVEVFPGRYDEEIKHVNAGLTREQLAELDGWTVNPEARPVSISLMFIAFMGSSATAVTTFLWMMATGSSQWWWWAGAALIAVLCIIGIGTVRYTWESRVHSEVERKAAAAARSAAKLVRVDGPRRTPQIRGVIDDLQAARREAKPVSSDPAVQGAYLAALEALGDLARTPIPDKDAARTAASTHLHDDPAVRVLAARGQLQISAAKEAWVIAEARVRWFRAISNNALVIAAAHQGDGHAVPESSTLLAATAILPQPSTSK
jgi:hypothetical protein